MSNAVPELLAQAAELHPDDTALVEASTGRRLSWAQLDDEVERVAAGFADAGLVAGHRVLIALSNRIEFVTTYLAALRARLVAVPVNPRSNAATLQRMCEASGARLAVGDECSVSALRSGIDQGALSVRVVTVATTLRPGELGYDQLAVRRGRRLPPISDPEALAALLFTTAADGEPRAVMLTHRALLANIEQLAQVQPTMVGADDVVLGVLPLFHIYGLNAVLGMTLRSRARLVIAESFDPIGTLDLIDDEAVSVAPVAPPVFAHWLATDDLAVRMGSVRLVLSGSATLPADIAQQFSALANVQVHQGYGLTEAAPALTTTFGADAAAGSLGVPLPGVELRIVEPDGVEVEPGDPGEIEVRGANLFSGYWPDGAEAPNDDGWWRTGDVGFHDANGSLFLLDRASDVINVAGFKVYPVEVEIVLGMVEGVSECVVLAAEDGASVVAHLLLDEAASEADVLAAVSAQAVSYLAEFKRPSSLQVVSELPRSGSGEVSRGKMRAAQRRAKLNLIDEGDQQ